MSPFKAPVEVWAVWGFRERGGEGFQDLGHWRCALTEWAVRLMAFLLSYSNGHWGQLSCCGFSVTDTNLYLLTSGTHVPRTQGFVLLRGQAPPESEHRPKGAPWALLLPALPASVPSSPPFILHHTFLLWAFQQHFYYWQNFTCICVIIWLVYVSTKTIFFIHLCFS